jgi:hypothetical protein
MPVVQIDKSKKSIDIRIEYCYNELVGVRVAIFESFAVLIAPTISAAFSFSD